MATSLQEGEAVPTCSICVDVFRDPVTLPCQHDFCRPCVQMFAEMSKPTCEADTIDVKDTDHAVAVTVTCPVCRSPAELGNTGVAGLPTNTSLADLVRKFQAEDNTCGQDIPKCSLCEDDNSPAVKSCRTCTVLYCQDCFTAFHPMRGALRRHDVIPVEEFLSLRATEIPGTNDKSGTTEDAGATARDPGDSTHPVPCDKHRQPLSIFCVTCEEVICVECLENHNDHTTRSLKSACEKLKASLVDKTGEYMELKDQMDKLRTEMNALYEDIQGNEDAHRDDIDRAYTTATEVLNCWRREALEVVEKRHSDWRREWTAAMKDLDMKTEEIDRMIETSKDLISSLQVTFLKGFKQLKTRLEDQLPDISTSLKRREEIKAKMGESVRLDPVIPRRLLVKESLVSRPEMKFSETNDEDLEIVDDGSMVEAVGTCFGQSCSAWTDVCLPQGESYWEIEIRIQPGEDNYEHQCNVGVKHQGSDYSKDSAWWMGLDYEDDDFRCGSRGDVIPVYKQWRPHTGSHRLGFYLDTEKRTLTIVDCDENEVMFTSHFIDVSKPLVAGVDFFAVESASARLITGHSCSFPRVIFD